MLPVWQCHSPWHGSKSQNTVRGGERQCAGGTGGEPTGTKLAWGDAALLPRSRGWLIGIGGALQRVEGGLRLFQDTAVRVFPGSKEKNRQRSSQSSKLRLARNFDLALPANDLRRNERSENSPIGQGQ